MNNVEKKIAFYGTLVEIIHDEKFVESSAAALVKLYKEIKSIVSIADVTVEFLREAFEEYHDQNRDFDITEEITETAFKDLAKHMRSPEVRRVFVDLTNLSGTFSPEDLFVHTTKVRLLSESADGMAVVTLVVDSYKGLQNLLESNPRKSKVEVVHSV